MRIIGNIPHPSFKITAYSLERHYYVELEAGPMKQCYKLHKENTDGMAGIQKWLSPEFLAGVKRIFDDMYQNHKASIQENL